MNNVYKAILNQLNVGIILFDQHYTLLYANHFIRDNHKRRIVIGNSLLDEFPELPKEWFKKRVESVVMFHNTSFTHWQYRPHLLELMETRPITGTHELMYQNCSLVYLGQFEGRELIALIVQDSTQTALTQLKLAKTLKKLNEEHRSLLSLNQKLEETQSQLVQNEKMAAVGQLAAGIAHEINNPMSFIKSNIECLQDYTQRLLDMNQSLNDLFTTIDNEQTKLEFMKKKESFDLDVIVEELPEILAETLDGTRRIQDITMSLRDFSRLDSDGWQLADVHSGIQSTLKIINHELKYSTCEIVLDFTELPLIYCLPAQLNQVFLNLLMNASQAVSKDGVIRIETRLLKAKECITIRISDNGVGISEENMKKIFNPFFTTKAVGLGTGLGLSISYKIIQAHQGTIEVESKQGEGTSFLITLPISKSDVDH